MCIRDRFKGICPLASQIPVHADGRRYATALISLDPDALAQWARAQGFTPSGYGSLARHPAVHDYVRSSIEELNGRLNRWETIKDFRILDHDMSVEGDELTPSLKIKRKAIEANYSSMLASMYEASGRG